MNKSIQILYIFLLSTFPNCLFSQTPIISPQIHSIEDIQNSEYSAKNYSKLWIKSKVNRNKKWIESSTYFEFDKKGNIKTKITEWSQNGSVIKDTVKFTYNNSGLWKTKSKSGKVITRNIQYNDKGLITKITTTDGDSTIYQYLDNNNLKHIKYGNKNWKTFEYSENDRLKSEKTYRDSSLYQIDNYHYDISTVKHIKMNIFSYSPKDTTIEISTSYYNSDTLLTKIITKIKDYDNWIQTITSMRYEKGLLKTITDCLNNDSDCGYADYLYDKKNNLKSVISYTKDGLLKTRETSYKYEFW